MEPGISSDSKDDAKAKESQTFEYRAPDLLDAPPPSYPEAQSQSPIPIDNQGPPSRENPAYPPLPHHTQAPSLTLHVRYESWRTNDVRILDADGATTLYTLKLQLRKPQMTIDAASATATIGTVTFPFLTSRIETTVHDSPITLTSLGLLKKGHAWSSPALGNAAMTWKTKSRNLDLVCSDAQGVMVARFDFPNWGLRKVGKFEMFGSEVTRGAVLEEILVTGLAMVEYNLGLANLNVLA